MTTFTSVADFSQLQPGDTITRRGVSYRYLGGGQFEPVEVEVLAKRFDCANDGPLLLPPSGS